MRPTALGIKAALFVVLVTAAFVASPYTNLFFLLLSFLAVVLALGTLWTWTNLRGLSVQLADARPFPADRTDDIAVEFLTVRRAHLSLEVAISLAGERRPRVVARCPMVGAGTPMTCTGALPALPRGVHAIRAAFIRSKHPFGLWWRRLPIAAPAELVVHPTPLDEVRGSRETIDGDDMFALLGARSTDAPAGLRDWTVGDALHAVDWRATARRSRPIVKEFDRSVDRGITVSFDRRCDEHTFERCLSALVTLCERARESDQPLQLTTQGMSITYGVQHRSLDQLLRWLAQAQALPADAEPLPVTAPDAIRLGPRGAA